MHRETRGVVGTAVKGGQGHRTCHVQGSKQPHRARQRVSACC